MVYSALFNNVYKALNSISVQNMLARTSSQANLGKMAIRAVLKPLGLGVLHYLGTYSPCHPHQ